MRFENVTITSKSRIANKPSPYPEGGLLRLYSSYQYSRRARAVNKVRDHLFEEHNIPDISEREETAELTSVLNGFDLPFLRQLHSINNPIAFGETNGSVSIDRKKVTRSMTFRDVQHPETVYSLHRGEEILTMDLVPFGKQEKTQELSTESMFLICFDLRRTISQTHADLPRFLLGETNPEMANFLLNRLRAKIYEGEIYERRKKRTIQDASILPLMREYIAGKKTIEKDGDIEIKAFFKTEELFSEQTVQILNHYIEVLTKRLGRKYNTNDIESLEKELRIKAIVESILSNYEEEGNAFSIRQYSSHWGAVLANIYLTAITIVDGEELIKDLIKRDYGNAAIRGGTGVITGVADVLITKATISKVRQELHRQQNLAITQNNQNQQETR